MLRSETVQRAATLVGCELRLELVWISKRRGNRYAVPGLPLQLSEWSFPHREQTKPAGYQGLRCLCAV